MTRLLHAEALRLATTRAYWLLAAGATALIASGTAATAAATSFTPVPARPAPSWPSPDWPRPPHCSPAYWRSPANSGTRPSPPPC